jgi:hypothetical protein
MQIEMSNAAAKKEVVVVNQPANSTNDYNRNGEGLEWSCKRSGNWCWSRCCNWRDY